MTKYLGLHETLEVLEILTFKSLCVTKSSVMGGLVQDMELKTLLANDASTGVKHIQRLQEFLTNREDKE
jgi:similar to spore coat protein